MAKKFYKVIAVILVMVMVFNIPCMPVLAAEPVVEEDTIDNADGTVTQQKTTTKTEVDPETGNVTVIVTIEKDTNGTTHDGVEYEGTETRVETTVTDKDGNVLSEGYEEDGNATKKWTEDVTPEDTDLPELELDMKPDEPAVSDSATDTKTKDLEDGFKATIDFERVASGFISKIVTNVNDISDLRLTGVGPEVYEGKKFVTDAGVADGTPDATIYNHYHKYTYTDDKGNEVNTYYPIVDRTEEEYNLLPDEIKALYQAPTTPGGRYIPLDKDNAWSAFDDGVEWDYVVGQIPESPFVGNLILQYSNGAQKERGISMIGLHDKNGNLVYTYCMDAETNANVGFMYTIENLENATYMPGTAEEQAESKAHIRAVVENGYWGTATGQGSLAQLKEDLKAALLDGLEISFDFKARVGDTQNVAYASYNTEEDLAELLAMVDSITEGDALLATQAAIWEYGHTSDNINNLEFGTYKSFTPGAGVGAGVKHPVYTTDEEHMAGEARLELIKEYLISDYLKEKTALENNGSVIITDDIFLTEEGLNLKIGDKISDGDVGTDGKEHDVYSTDLSFQMVVTPTEDDHFVLTLISSDGTVERQVYLGQNEDANGDDFVCDNGVYTFKNVPLAENSDITFDLVLEGVQYLDRGVYIYRSTAGYDKEQTMVGLAEGEKDIDVSAQFTLSFTVDEEKNIVAKKDWHEDEYTENIPPEDDNGSSSGTNGNGTHDNEEAPSSGDSSSSADGNSPQTGDPFSIWPVLAALSAMFMLAFVFYGKRRA
ncbi:MAG: Cys-Gln thioester bond-forming surface protein [Firmicutes bacterium]|nr:Cys-Gln thioester bond-forming surface protein [Bacillota bacterium]